jgi:hypothetical protein
MSVLLVADGVEDPQRDEREIVLDRLLRLPAPSHEDERVVAKAADLGEIARVFAAQGAGVIALERPTGRVLPLGIRGQTAVIGAPKRVA